MITFEEFQRSNARPQIELVDLREVDAKTYSEQLGMKKEEIVSGDFVQICDRPIWLAKSTDSRGKLSYFSSDGDVIFSFAGKRNTMLAYRLNEKNQLTLVDSTNILDNLSPVPEITPAEESQSESVSIIANSLKEEKEMSGDVSLTDLVNSAKSAVNPPTPAPQVTPRMESFGESAGGAAPEDAEKKEMEKQKELYQKALKQFKNAARQELEGDDISLLVDAWKETAEFIAWITPNEPRASITAVKVPVKWEDRELVPSAPENVKAQFNKDRKSVAPEYIKTVYKMMAKESKPGKAVGALAKIPAFLKGKSVQEFTQKIVLDGPKDEAGRMGVIEMLKAPDFEQKIGLVNGVIKEYAGTHGGVSGELSLDLTISKSQASNKDGLSTNIGSVITRKFTRSGDSKSLMLDTNFFPLVTYEKYDIATQLPQEIIDELNATCFTSLFSKGKAPISKIRMLSDEERANFTEKDGHITSKYITNNVGEKITLKLTAFHRAFDRPTIKIPVKRSKLKEDGTMGAMQFVKYSATNEAEASNPEYLAKTSLGNGEYAHIISIVGEEILNPHTLKETFKRSGGGGAGSKVIDHITARAFLKSKITGSNTFDDFTISGLKFSE